MKVSPGPTLKALFPPNHCLDLTKDECGFGISSFEDDNGCRKFSSFRLGKFVDDPLVCKVILKDTLSSPARLERKEGLCFFPSQNFSSSCFDVTCNCCDAYLERRRWKRLDGGPDTRQGFIVRSPSPSSSSSSSQCIPVCRNEMNIFNQTSSTSSGIDGRYDFDDDNSCADGRAIDETEQGGVSASGFRRVRAVRLKRGRTYPEEAMKRRGIRSSVLVDIVGKQGGNSLWRFELLVNDDDGDGDGDDDDDATGGIFFLISNFSCEKAFCVSQLFSS